MAGFAKWPQRPGEHLLHYNVSCLSLLYKDYLVSSPLLFQEIASPAKFNIGFLITKTQVLSPYSKPADTQLVKKFTGMYETVSLISVYHICMDRHVQERSVLAKTARLFACPREV